MPRQESLVVSRPALGDDLPATARQRLREFAGPVLDDATLNDSLLVLSELVTNALLHGGISRSVNISFRLSGERMWVGVTQPGPFEDSNPDEGGMGLKLVERIANRWGVMESDNTSVVWFEMEPIGVNH